MVFAACGGILTWHRPRNPIGWLFVAAGMAHATTAVAAPSIQVLIAADVPLIAQRLAVTAFAWSWPWSIGLCLPLALLLFPDGRPPSARWWWVVVAVIVTAPLFAMEMGTSPEPIEPGIPVGFLTFSGYAALQPLWTATEIRGLLALGLGLAALAVRYRRGSEVERRQLLWLLLAVLVALIVILPWGLVAGTPIEVLFAIPLIPIAVTVAIVRHQLLDIRLVVSRLLAWLMLLLAVVVAYAGLVALLDRSPPRGLAGRLWYGAARLVGRAFVATAATARGRCNLWRPRRPSTRGFQAGRAAGHARCRPAGSGHDGPFRFAAPLSRDRARGKVLASDGEPPESIHPWPLTHGGKSAGQLMVGLRPGERELAAADRRALAMLADPVAARCNPRWSPRNSGVSRADRCSTRRGAAAIAPRTARRARSDTDRCRICRRRRCQHHGR